MQRHVAGGRAVALGHPSGERIRAVQEGSKVAKVAPRVFIRSLDDLGDLDEVIEVGVNAATHDDRPCLTLNPSEPTMVAHAQILVGGGDVRP